MFTGHYFAPLDAAGLPQLPHHRLGISPAGCDKTLCGLLFERRPGHPVLFTTTRPAQVCAGCDAAAERLRFTR